MHLRSLEKHDFDSVLLPYNYLLHRNEAYRREFDALRQVCRERNVAVRSSSLRCGLLGREAQDAFNLV